MQPSKEDNRALLSDMPQLQALWKKVFGDADKFISLIFDSVIKPENALVIKLSNTIVSMLYILPYRMKIRSRILSAAYIYGVATDSDFRGKGYMKQLMNEALNEIKNRNYDIAVLIPAENSLFDFYKQYGFTNIINYGLEIYKHKDIQQVYNYEFIKYNKDYYSYFNSKQEEREYTVLHDLADIEIVKQYYEDENCYIPVAVCNGKTVGIAFSTPSEYCPETVSSETASPETVIIKEIMYDNISVKTALIHHILHYYHAKTAEVRVPASFIPVSTCSSCHQTIPYAAAYSFVPEITDISETFMALMLD